MLYRHQNALDVFVEFYKGKKREPTLREFTELCGKKKSSYYAAKHVFEEMVYTGCFDEEDDNHDYNC